MKDTIERIKQMEECFDTLLNAAANPSIIQEDPHLQELLAQLTAYYEGGQWLYDYDMDALGRLPPELKRGVLSQDAVYNFLAQFRNNLP